jgi:ketosteroid isomerase-like protein
VLVEVRFRAEGKASGVTTEVEFPFIWTFKNGEAVQFESFANRAEALEAAGMPE